MEPLGATRPHPKTRGAELPDEIRSLLVCPACRCPLEWTDEITCCGCARVYEIDDGIPVLALDGETGHDEVDHLLVSHEDAVSPHLEAERQKHTQAAFFDRIEAEEFEIERPAGQPALYGRLLREKARRAIESLGHLEGRTAVVVCGGSGMDAEFLAERGAQVLTTDISIGAARRARERSERTGLTFWSIVADAEHLPFQDATVPLAYVHDGLHHMPDPLVGVAEMCRVSGWAVAITEPARAAATSVAVQFGLALEAEEAGNRVARLLPAEIAAIAVRSGLRVVRANRYAMYYRHRPGAVMRTLSRPGIVSAAWAGWRLGNAMLGRFGNKLVVVARRD